MIDGKVYNCETSEKLHSAGNYRACSVGDGNCSIFKTKNGAVWARVLYWPNSFGDMQVRVYTGKEGAIKALTVTNQLSNYLDDVAEAIGYAVEEA